MFLNDVILGVLLCDTFGLLWSFAEERPKDSFESCFSVEKCNGSLSEIFASVRPFRPFCGEWKRLKLKLYRTLFVWLSSPVLLQRFVLIIQLLAAHKLDFGCWSLPNVYGLVQLVFKRIIGAINRISLKMNSEPKLKRHWPLSVSLSFPRPVRQSIFSRPTKEKRKSWISSWAEIRFG